MKIQYIDKKFSRESIAIIEKANSIINEYGKQGFTLTLRQLYYQFVSRDYIPNTPQSYKRLGSIVNDARLAGLLSWEAIEDRTRSLASKSHWDSPVNLIADCAKAYHTDLWENQDYRVEVWVEKEALAGVVKSACFPLDVPYFCCRGYVSQSEMWRAAYERIGGDYRWQTTIILYLGDHDPSGIDMTRDIEDRLSIFRKHGDFEVERIALNLDQIEKFEPPPNPAKVTDSRFKSYMNKFGDESWELDALEPSILVNLIKSRIKEYLDNEEYSEAKTKEDIDRSIFEKLAINWDRVKKYLERR